MDLLASKQNARSSVPSLALRIAVQVEEKWTRSADRSANRVTAQAARQKRSQKSLLAKYARMLAPRYSILENVFLQ